MQQQPQRYLPPQPAPGPGLQFPPQPGQFPPQHGTFRPGLAPMPGTMAPPSPAGLPHQMAAVSLSSSQPVMSPAVVKPPQPRPSPPAPNGVGVAPPAGPVQSNGAAPSPGLSSLQQRYPAASLPPQHRPPQPGIPLASMPGMPPASMPGMTPASMPGMPPASMPGMPPASMPGMPPASMPGMPPASMPGMPPASMPGIPPASMPGMPPASMPGIPPASMPGMPPASMPGMPPASMPGMPPASTPGAGGMMPGGGPPGSMHGAFRPGLPGQPPLHSPASVPSPGYLGGPPVPGGAPMPGGPPMPGGHSMPGGPPMPGGVPMPGGPPMPGGVPMPGGPPMPGGVPMPGGPPMPGGVPMPGGPPMPGGVPMPGGPPMPGGVPMPGGPPMPGAPPAGPGAAYPPPPGAYGQMPGMSPRPGMGAHMPAPAGQMGARKLDPDQMPSPIQVMADDQASRSGQFVTNLKGQVPPLTTTEFSVVDQGNASPRLIRSSMYNVPAAPDMLKQTSIPLALSISPLAELPEGERPPPVVDLGELGPVRCIRCKAYMCPFMSFIDGGRRFSCPFCKANTDVPQEYFQHLDHTGQRLDKYDRPELCLGAYEFVCTREYCRNNTFPKPPAYIFVIDVSYNNVKSGLVHLLCSNMKEILRQLPVDVGQSSSKVKVGFITYSHVVHFFNVKACLAQPQMLVVGDVQDMFVPLVDGLLVDAGEAEAVIDSLLEQLPLLFADTRETELVLGPAIQAGMEALKAADCCGRLFVFHSSLPIGEAPGKLKNRDDRKVLGSEKEKHVLTPQTQFYNNLGQECVQAGCSVSLFLLNNAYVDLATVGQVVRLTGGEVHKYTYFQADRDGPRLLRDLGRAVRAPAGLDAIMRVRTSTGVRPVDFHGHFFMSNTTDMELAGIDANQAVTVELKHDDKLTEEDGVYIQAALLYTAVSGQRRLRVINLSLSVCQQMADMYRSCELDTISNLMLKQAVSRLLDSSPRAVRDGVTAQCAQMLASYRKHCASPSSAGQLILPECMKLLPLYANCILRSDAAAGGPELTIDERSHHMYMVTSMPVRRSVAYLYPRLLPLDDLDPGETGVPAAVRSSADKLHDQGLFLLENGVHLFLWVGLQADPAIVQDLFAVPSVAQIDVDRPSLPELDTPVSVRVRGIIEEVRAQRQAHMKLTVVRQRDKLEPVLKHFLVEDKGSDGGASYVDYLCHLHKEIRALLT